MRSLRLRLLIGAVVGIGMALSLAGIVLVQIFDAHIRQRYVKELDDHLIQLVAMIEVAPPDAFKLRQELSEPEFQRPFSGHYWQVERQGQMILRSRSLWDEALALRRPLPDQGVSRSYELVGPLKKRVIVVEKLIELPAPVADFLVFAVAGESSVIDSAKQDFASVVALSLLILGALLAAASWLQVGAGLAPLRSLQASLETMQKGAVQRVEGSYPAELVGLVSSLNRLIETQEAEAERARSNAAKLGHGLKTPLAVMAAEARALRRAGETVAADAIDAEIDSMNSHVARALASARAVGPRVAPGTRTDIASVANRLVAVLKKLPRGGSIEWTMSLPAGMPPVRVDRRDIEDILGNLFDNARKWARTKVDLSAHRDGGALVVVLDDDGPGVPAERMDDVLVRGVRLDIAVPGTGVGLSIVKDLVELCGGSMALSESPRGGLRVTMSLPVAAAG